MADNFERFGRQVDEKMKDFVPKMEAEVQRVIRYLNDEVVPDVRRHGSQALRTASEQLQKLADYMESKKPGE
jgi:hypothetical protein